MPLFPVFGLRTLLLLMIPVSVAVIILAVVSSRGANIFKKQGVAWVVTGVMILCAVGIGYSKAHTASSSCVWDDANVLSSQTERTLDRRNDRLWDNYGVTIGVVTCNYGRDDLDEYAAKQFGAMGLGRDDMLVVLDISGSACWLYTGDNVSWKFTDRDSFDYVYEYVEPPFVRGDYDTAVLDLTEMLEAWYGVYYF